MLFMNYACFLQKKSLYIHRNILEEEREKFMGIEFNSDVSKVKNFDNWTNSEENFNKAVSGEQVEDFQLFEFNAPTYSKDIKNIAQEYINLYDENGDGEWNKEEFVKMALGGQEIPAGLEDAYADLFGKAFDDLNLDDKKDSINSAEFASQLFIGDLDLQKFADTDGSLVDSLDGKINYVQYNLNSDPDYVNYDYVQDLKSAFYNNFYADEE